MVSGTQQAGFHSQWFYFDIQDTGPAYIRFARSLTSPPGAPFPHSFTGILPSFSRHTSSSSMLPRAARLLSARADDSDEDLVDDSSRLRAAIASATAPSACGVRAFASTFSIVAEDAASRRPATDAHTAVMRALEANLQLQRTCRTQLTMIERALQQHERTRIRMDDMAADCAADQSTRIQRVINARWRPTVQPLLPSDPSVRPPPTADALRRAGLHAAVPLQPPREWATSMPWSPALGRGARGDRRH